ncbi:MAG: YggT family protein [Lacisediminihabitans sp.]
MTAVPVVPVLATIVYFLLLIYFLALWARFVLDLARGFARQWRPRGLTLVIAEFVFTITDPPIRLVRRALPPLRLGGIALDFAWSAVMLAVIILMAVVTVFRI